MLKSFGKKVLNIALMGLAGPFFAIGLVGLLITVAGEYVIEAIHQLMHKVDSL